MSARNGTTPVPVKADRVPFSRWRELTLTALLAAPLIVLLVFVDPIPQDQGYHALADTRTVFEVPNFANVASNIPFLIVGALGLRLCLSGHGGGARASWIVFFAGTAAVAAGSAYYHWAPGDARLAWDRLPLTVVVMGLFSALLAEHLRRSIERVFLPASLAVGVAGVAWWRYADDLRLYAWVQFAPLVALAFLLTAYPARYTHRGYIAGAAALYALAKVAEHFDSAVFEVTSRAVSGHTIKHLLAALALFVVYRMLMSRGTPAVLHKPS